MESQRIIMTLAKKEHSRSRILTIFTVLVVLAGMVLPVINVSAAAVTIKTQKAADSIVGGIRGIDVSKHNGTINWKKVAEDDVSFVFCRASYGTDEDPMFVTNMTEARRNGLKVGAYHYARFKNSASMKKEAAFFLKQLKKVTVTYPVVLDLENHYNLSKTKLTNLAIEFMKIIEDEGYRVMLYSYQNFFTSYLNLNKFSKNQLWVANYVEAPRGIDHVAWQHTSYGTVRGISGRVDINIAYKSLTSKAVGRSSPQSEDVNDEKDKDLPRTTTKTKAETPAPTPEAPKRSSTASIINFLNEHYNAGLSASDPIDMDNINHIMACAFQTEINKQLNGNLTVDGFLTDTEVGYLSDITFLLDQTKGRITTLVQTRLYFDGYLDIINGIYDSTMVESITSFQSACGIEATGTLTKEAWSSIFNFV